MALIEPEKQSQKVKLEVEVESETMQQLKHYVRFCGVKDHGRVVDGALQLLFEKDEGFRPWLEEKRQKDRDQRERRLGEKGNASAPAKE